MGRRNSTGSIQQLQEQADGEGTQEQVAGQRRTALDFCRGRVLLRDGRVCGDAAQRSRGSGAGSG